MFEEHVLGFLGNAWQTTLALAPWLLLGTFAAGLLHFLMPEHIVRRNMSGYAGVVRAVLLGIPLPLCSCGVIPAAVGLKRDGAGNGPAIGFLISTPQTGMDSILVSASFLGWPFALFKILSSLVMGLAGGFAAEFMSPSRERPASNVQPTARPGIKDVMSHSLEIIRSIWKWLIFGVLVSAAISSFLPVDYMQRFYSLGSFWTALVMLAVSLPLYVCSTSSVPIAAALVAGGMPAGAALVFLVAGPASNAATIGAVYKTFGPKLLGVYLSVMLGGSLLLGLTFDQVISTAPVHMTHVHGEAAGIQGYLSVASAVLLAGLLAFFAVQEISSLARSKAENGASVPEAGHCEHCAMKAKKSADDCSATGAKE